MVEWMGLWNTFHPMRQSVLGQMSWSNCGLVKSSIHRRSVALTLRENLAWSLMSLLTGKRTILPWSGVSTGAPALRRMPKTHLRRRQKTLNKKSSFLSFAKHNKINHYQQWLLMLSECVCHYHPSSVHTARSSLKWRTVTNIYTKWIIQVTLSSPIHAIHA